MTNNEDEVVHIEQWQQYAAKPLQAIVKLQDYSRYTIVAKTPQSLRDSSPKQGSSSSSPVLREVVQSTGGISGQGSSSSSPVSGEVVQSTGGVSDRVVCPAIQAVLDSFVIESVEQLCPTFVMPREPRRSASYGGGEVRDHDLSQLYLITLSPESPKREHELIEALSALDEVEYAEPNYLVFALGGESDSPASRNLVNLVNQADATYVDQNNQIIPRIPNTPRKSTAAAPTDPMYAMQWGIPACGIDSLLTAPKRDTSWRPIICILDTGVDIDHPDLSDNIWTNAAEADGAANQDDDANGFADDVHGWDFVNQTADMHDFNSHGTHCAGIAGAVTNNGIGIAGACPDALIMPVSVM